MAMNDVLSSLAQKLGLKMTELDDLRQLQRQLEERYRMAADQVEELKAQVTQQDVELTAKKAEYAQAQGVGMKFIIKGEYDRLKQAQNQTLEAFQVLNQRIANMLQLVHQVGQLIQQKQMQTNQDTLLRLTDDIDVALDDLREEQRSIDQLASKSFVQQPREQRVTAAPAATLADPLDAAMSDLPASLGAVELPDELV